MGVSLEKEDLHWMKNLENLKKKDITEKTKMEYLPFFLLAVFLLPYFLTRPLTGDDFGMFYPYMEEYTLWEFTVMRHNTWSSRQVIEIFCYYLVHYFEVWAVMQTILCLVFCRMVTEFYPVQSVNVNWLVCLVFLIFPMESMGDVGWVATSTNYFWVLVALVFSLHYLRKVYVGEKIEWWFLLCQILATTYANSHEQGVALYLGFYLTIFLLLSVKCKMTDKLQWKPREQSDKKEMIIRIMPFLIWSFLAAVYHLTCVGNEVRFNRCYMQVAYFRDFDLLDKLELGVFFLFVEFLNRYHNVYLFAVFLLLIFSYLKNSRKIFYLTCVLPLFISVALFCVDFATLADLMSINTRCAILYAGNRNLFTIVVDTMLYSGCIAFISATILSISSTEKKFWFGLLLLAGFMSQFICSFSPTVYFSIPRTMLFFLFAILMVTLGIYDEIEKFENKKVMMATNGTMILFVISNVIKIF